jgi:polyisoprenoid-binding protein YceI
MKKIYLLSLVCIMLCAAIAHGQTYWKPYSSNVSFKIKNAGLNVNGSFDTVTAKIVFGSSKLGASELYGKAAVNSLHTGIGMRDKDLKKEEYFDTAKYKYIEIKSVKLYYKNAQYAGLFDVTIKGITKQIEIPFEFNELADEAEIKGSFTIDRRDFKVGGESRIMGDNVTVTIDIKAKK